MMRINCCSGHDRIASPLNSQHLWLPTQDQNKIKPVNIIAQTRRDLWAPTCHLETFESYWLLRERDSVFYKDVVTVSLAMIQWTVPHPGVYK